MSGGTVRARIGGDLFDVARLGAVRRAPDPRPASAEPTGGEPAPDPFEDPLAEHRLPGSAIILALPGDTTGSPDAHEDRDLFGAPADGRSLPPSRSGSPSAKGSSGPGRSQGAGRASPSPSPGPGTPGPATDRQLGFAGDIAKTLRIPMPEGRDVETISGFIALHRNQLKGNRGRP